MNDESKKYTELKSARIRDLKQDEKWLQNVIAENPEILGLGDDVFLRDKERRQPSGGRIDILLETDDGDERFELEVQLGTTDETHIVRTIEYWDIERHRYPNIDHTAVIAAEEISSRFFNVIDLLGKNIPLIALKVTAFDLSKFDLSPDKKIGLYFFKVLDTRDLIASRNEDEDTEPTDRAYWVGKAGEGQVKLAEDIISDVTGGRVCVNENI